MDHAEFERQAPKMNGFAKRMTTDVGGLVQRRQVRPSLHLHHRIALAIEQVEVLAILEECALDGNGALVVEYRAPLEKRRHIRVAERVVKTVRVAGVLVVD